MLSAGILGQRAITMQGQKFEQLRVVRSQALVSNTQAALGLWVSDGRAFALEIPSIAAVDGIRRHLDKIAEHLGSSTTPT
jgi:hypothetical protein